MSTVFISYRRENTAGEARALFNDLVARLGESSVFMDVDSIALGRDFRIVLEETTASCDLMLVLIGRNWIDAKDEGGRIRLENPGDYVRLEIEAALKRNIPVTPVLVQGAQMPAAEQLPPTIRDLAYRNGFELSNNRWASDVREMLRRLHLDVPDGGRQIEPDRSPSPAVTPKRRPLGASQPKSTRWPVWVLVPAFIIVAIGGGLLVRSRLDHTNSVTQQAPDGYAALGAFENGSYKNFDIVSGGVKGEEIKGGEIMRPNPRVGEVYLRTNTEDTRGGTNPSLGTIAEGGCVKVLKPLPNIRGQTWAAVKQLAKCG